MKRMIKLAGCLCIFAFVLKGSESAFFTTSTKSRFNQRPLKNAYLESLAGSERVKKRDISAATVVGSANLGRPPPYFQTHFPVVEEEDNPTKPAYEGSLCAADTTKDDGQQALDAKVLSTQRYPTRSKVIHDLSVFSQEKSEEFPGVTDTRKPSYESERQRYDQVSFEQNLHDASSGQQQNLRRDEEIEDAVVQAAVVEVLPKDPPNSLEDSRHEYLFTKNMELEQENSDLQRENEQHKFELESFLRDSLSNPLHDHIAANGALWNDDSLIEANSRLRSENEIQRHDLRAIQSEMNELESIIQSIEDRAYVETQKLENLNIDLRDENERHKQQIESFTLQMSNMQSLLQSIRDEAVSLNHEKKNIQNDNDLMTIKLRGSESDNERKSFELGNGNEQISSLQGVIEIMKNDFSKLQNQHNLVIKDKASLELEFDGTVGEFEKQRYELEAYKKDRASMESLAHSIRDESEALKDDKKELQEALLNMKVTMEDMSQQLLSSQSNLNILSVEKEDLRTQNKESQRRLQTELQDSFTKLKGVSDEKNELEARLTSAEIENERQRYEIENSSRDKRALEVMIQSIQRELESLKNEKTTMESTIIAFQQENEKLDLQLSISKEEMERLRGEKDAAISQSNENYDHYQQLQFRYQEVLDELELCQHDGARRSASVDYEGVDQDFMSRINSRQQNQMRRNQINEPRNSSWWN